MPRSGSGAVSARQGAGGADWLENRPPQGWLPPLGLKEAWQRRELARFFAMRDLQLRYKQTLFGVGWALLQPLGAMAILVLTLDQAADVPSDGLPYGLFVFAGLALWFYVSHAISGAAESLVDDPDLVTKVWFPRVLAPGGALFSWLLDLAITLIALAILMAAYGESPGPQLITLPLWIAAAVLLAFGAGLGLAALNVLYRDVRYTLGFVLQIWLLASPVLYAGSGLGDTGQTLLALNPVTGLLDGFRWSVLDAPAPTTTDLISLATGLALLVAGLLYFRAVESRFADRI